MRHPLLFDGCVDDDFVVDGGLLLIILLLHVLLMKTGRNHQQIS